MIDGMMTYTSYKLLNIIISFMLSHLSVSQDISEAAKDCTITISPSKAKELNLKSGQIVGIIGRRRRAAYAIVNIAKGKKSSIGLGFNLATNLRVRDTDKVKIVPLGASSEEDFSFGASGDMALMGSTPSIASSVTFSPVRDSLHSLELSEGGDELSEDEIMNRFVVPYLDLEDGGNVVLKKGHTLVLRDANKMVLEFTVTHLGMGEGDDEEVAEDDGKSILFVRYVRYSSKLASNKLHTSTNPQKRQLVLLSMLPPKLSSDPLFNAQRLV